MGLIAAIAIGLSALGAVSVTVLLFLEQLKV